MKILIFDSIHHVLKAEKLLMADNIKVDLIPVPKEVHSNCGMAISLDDSSLSKCENILKSNNINFKIFTFNEELNFYMEEA